jgi:hypothetical protein
MRQRKTGTAKHILARLGQGRRHRQQKSEHSWSGEKLQTEGKEKSGRGGHSAEDGDRPRQRPAALVELGGLQQRPARETENDSGGKQTSNAQNSKRESRPVETKAQTGPPAV